MPTPCQTLQKEYRELEKLQKQFEVALDEAVKTNDTRKAKELKAQIEEKLQSLREKIIPKELKSIFISPENNERKEIVFNVQEKIKEWQDFYQKFNLSFNEQEVKKIFQKHKQEIQKEMKTYGYDEILIIPENLPSTENLNRTLIESMTNTTETYQSDNFKNGGGFSGAKHTEKNKIRIVLCHKDQNIYNNPETNFFEKQTLDKNIMQLSGLSQPEVERRIQNQEALPISFEIQVNSQKIQIQAEGLSLNEYLIFQRQFFEKNQKHLDEEGWTWLLKTFSSSRVVSSYWNPGAHRLRVDAFAAVASRDFLGCRLSRSFEN